MFKFSLNWLRDYCGKEISFDEIIKKLRLQGFEFQGSQEVDGDIITAIEVKANRPDMLSHIGIAREIKAFDGLDIPSIPKTSVTANNDLFPLKVNVNKDVCKRFCAVKLSNVDPSVKTPEYISRRLSVMGINSVNAVVDICNYVMLDLGQPMHCYDFDKLSKKELTVDKIKSDQTITTFSGEQAKLKSGDIVISENNEVKCVAGIIGTDCSSVSKETRNVILESAVFDEVSVRLTSRRLKISTPSSFRFERGVNSKSSFDVLFKCAEMITDICGGKIEDNAFDFYPLGRKDDFLDLNVKHNNDLLGINLDSQQIIECLERYNFKCFPESESIIKVQIPTYRLDVKQEVDIIEEVARIYGYDNIKPVMPTIQTQYNKNEIWDKFDVLRRILTGLGFNETINYSFIPQDSMQLLGISKGESLYSDVILKNPIASAYALMRPTMVYSLLSCLAYNYSVGNSNLGIFELGRVYFRNNEYDTGCEEKDTCAFMMSGIRIPRGFGCDKDIKYTYYDLLSILKVIFDEFGQEFELKENALKFCRDGSSYDIVVNGKRIGFIGEINKEKLRKVNNLKLIKDKIFYCEFYLRGISEKIKKIKFESKYPPIKRLYNLVQKKDIKSHSIADIITSSDEVVRSVTVQDVYSDKNFSSEEHAVLYEVNYCSKDTTLTSEKIEEIEKHFLKELSDRYNIYIKS